MLSSGRPQDRHRNEVRARIIAAVVIILILAFFVWVVPKALAETPPSNGGSEVPMPNVVTQYNITKGGLIGVMPWVFDGTYYVDCDRADCDPVVMKGSGSKTNYSVRLAPSQHLVSAFYTYKIGSRTRTNPSWSGRPLRGVVVRNGKVRRILFIQVGIVDENETAVPPDINCALALCPMH